LFWRIVTNAKRENLTFTLKFK
jgi:hypothetical protein